MRLALDVDGCVANWNTGFRTLLDAGRPKTWDDDWHPELWDWPTSLGYSVKDCVDASDCLKADPNYFAFLPAYPGTRSFLEWLWKRVSVANWQEGGSHEVYFLTDRKGLAAKDQTEKWLHNHGFSGRPPTVLMTTQGKGRILADLGITHFLDDKPENIADAMKHSAECRIFRYLRPWNQSLVFDTRVQNVHDLKEFQRILNSEF